MAAVELPVMVECPPYAAVVFKTACARRYAQANGLAEATVHGIKTSLCNACPLGERRVVECGAGRIQEMEAGLRCPFCKKAKRRLEKLPTGGRCCKGCKVSGRWKLGHGPALPGDASEESIGRAVAAEAAAVLAWKGDAPPTIKLPQVAPALDLSPAEKWIALKSNVRLLAKRHRIERDLMIDNHRREREQQAQAQEVVRSAAVNELDEFEKVHPGARAEVAQLLGEAGDPSEEITDPGPIRSRLENLQPSARGSDAPVKICNCHMMESKVDHCPAHMGVYNPSTHERDIVPRRSVSAGDGVVLK